MSAPKSSLISREATPLAVSDFDHVEYYVGNAKQAAYFYRRALGFDVVGYRGPETGVKDRVSYALRQNAIQIVLTAALSGDHPIAEHVKRHGDGVHAVAFLTSDAAADYAAAVQRGAQGKMDPTVSHDENGRVTVAEIGAYGETIHRFVEREGYRGAFLPGFAPLHLPAPHPTHLHRIDHAVANVGWNEMETWVEFYERVFGFFQFRHFDENDISTEFTALRSKVMASPSLAVKLPINEPAEGKKRSQIEEYIDFYGCPGVQHLAISSTDIIASIRRLQANGVEFQSVPESYYATIADRVAGIAEDVEDLKRLGILVDRDENGYLLQIFTKPIEDRPTFFFEIIQRRGSESFGKGNFKALFEAIERDQAARGTL